MPLRGTAPSLLNEFLAEYVAAKQQKDPSYAPPEAVNRFLGRMRDYISGSGNSPTEQEVHEVHNALMLELDSADLGKTLYGILFSDEAGVKN